MYVRAKEAKLWDYIISEWGSGIVVDVLERTIGVFDQEQGKVVYIWHHHYVKIIKNIKDEMKP